MVSFTSLVTKFAALTLLAGFGSSQSQNITYFRPTGDQVSGYLWARTPFVRSPCPALNSLANHGILPRNGYDITRQQYKEAVMLVFELTDSAADGLVRDLPDKCNLNFLATHDLIEHDASLASDDGVSGKDPHIVNRDMVEDICRRAQNGFITLNDIIDTLKARLDSCNKRWWPKCDYGDKQKQIGVTEISTLMNCLGRDERIPVAHFRSFFLENRVPEDWIPPQSKVDDNRLKGTQKKVRDAMHW